MLLNLSRNSLCALALCLVSVACIKPASNDVSVVGGEKDARNLPWTVKLSIKMKSGKTRTCAGVFISDTVLLTSGLCIDQAEKVTVESEIEPFKSDKVSSTKFEIHDSYKSIETSDRDAINFVDPKDAWADIGMVIFPKDTAPKDMIATVARTSYTPKVKDEVLLAGWGADSDKGSGVGTRRVGKNVIDSIASEDKKSVIGIEGNGNQRRSATTSVTLGSGDQGAPLYNEKSEVIGIASTHELNDSVSYFSNFSDSASRKFFEKEIAYEGSDSSRSDRSSGSSRNSLVKVVCERTRLTVTLLDVDGRDLEATLRSCEAEAYCEGADYFLRSSTRTSTSTSSTTTTNSTGRRLDSEKVCKEYADATNKELKDL